MKEGKEYPMFRECLWYSYGKCAVQYYRPCEHTKKTERECENANFKINKVKI